MSHPTLAKFQIGKNGLADGVITSLSNSLKTHKQVRISVLKSCCRDRAELVKLAKKIKSSLHYNLAVKTLGYTIILIKLKSKV